MNRRQALSLLATLPCAARLAAQTRLTAQHRVVISITHGFLLEPGGSLKSWACNPGGRDDQPASDALGLGHNRPIDSYVLYPVPGLVGVVAAAAGAGSSCALLADGRVLTWGKSARGVLGTTPLAEFEERAQSRASTNAPTPVATAFEASDVSCKGDHLLALARDGSVYAWGYGTSGQLGIGPLPIVRFKTRLANAMPEVPYPVRVPDLGDVAAIGAGDCHSLALLRDGTVRAWGDNSLGQVGDGTKINRDRPVTVPGVRDAVAIAAGSSFSVAVLSDGTAMTWGQMESGPRPVPAVVPGARGLRLVAAGGGHAVALTQTGTVMTFGDNTHYGLGRGRRAGSAAALVSGLTGVQSITANDDTGVAVLASGRVLTWGEVRPWTRPDDGGGELSPLPILLWVDGLEQP